MKKSFEFEFQDQSSSDQISFDYSDNDEEELRFGIADDEVFITANRAAFLCLAKLFVKLALGSYKPGFHIHIGEDFSGSSQGRSLHISLADSETTVAQ